MIGELLALTGAAIGLCAARGQAEESVRKASVELAQGRIPDTESSQKLRVILKGRRPLPFKILAARRAAIDMENQDLHAVQGDASSSQRGSVQLAQRDIRHLVEVGRLWIFVLLASVLGVAAGALQLFA